MRPLVSDAIDLLTAPLVQHRVTRVDEHRPWPMAPRHWLMAQRHWLMAQTWIDLLFAHWPLAPETLAASAPPQLPLDVHDRRAWITVSPFVVRNLRTRLSFPVPVLSAFPEINVRTYVTIGGKPGIYFFGLDAGSALAVAAARRFYRLPYFRATTSVTRDGDTVRFSSERTSADAPAAASFSAGYRAAGDAVRPRPGTLEHWLTERYCLYTLDSAIRTLRRRSPCRAVVANFAGGTVLVECNETVTARSTS